MGVEPSVDVDVTSDDVHVGDVYLLCSDGLHGFVEDDRIGAIVMATPVITSACADLIGEANGNGGGDNITAVLIRIEESDEPWAVSTSVPPAPGRQPVGPPVESLSSARLPEIIIGDEDTPPDSVVVAPAGDEEAAKAALEVDDTARFQAVTDPDAVLAGNLFDDDDDG